MTTEIIMPTVSNEMSEGILARWVKKEGDAVRKGEVIAEIETDKAVLELEADADGVIGALLVVDGATVPFGMSMGMIVTPGEPVPQSASTTPTAVGAAVASTGDASAGAATRVPVGASAPGSRVFASPVARNLSLLHGIELSEIRGSGPNGRVVKRDVEALLERIAAPSATVGASLTATPVAAPASAASRAPVAAQVQPATASSARVDFEEIPHSSMRRVIAQRLSESKQQVPHFYLSIDCQLDALLVLRRQINGALPEARISVNDFVVKAVAAALKKVPAANSSWSANAIRRYRNIDISIAVATDSGLLTPVVRSADAKSLGSVSIEVRDLAERARSGKMLPNEYQGGGFTISNLGMYGIREFAAIINSPQACILAVGAGEPRAVVREGAIVAATVMTCTLSADHRVVDGAAGAEFLAAFRSLIENPLALLV